MDSRIHTGNGLEFLKSICPNYKGEALYKNEPVVIYKNLVTASGTAPLEMAHHVIKYLNLFTDDTLDAWYNLHKTSEGKYFYALMESMQKQMS